MAEELEIIVNEEQFLADEEPMLEEATVKCEELTVVMETLRRLVTRSGCEPAADLRLSKSASF